MTLDYIQLDTDTPAPPATRELHVGCIRTTQLSPKKVTTALPLPTLYFCSPSCLALPTIGVGWAACWRVEGGGAGHPGPHTHCLQGDLQLQHPQTVDFSLDSMASLQHHGFAVEPTRGFVERGQTKTISISWMPPANFDVGATGCDWQVLGEPKAGQDNSLPMQGGGCWWALGG